MSWAEAFVIIAGIIVIGIRLDVEPDDKIGPISVACIVFLSLILT